MARVKVEKEICDICSGEGGYLPKCLLCSREICVMCRKSTLFHNDICKHCVTRDDFDYVFESFRKKFVKLENLEEKSFKQLPHYIPKMCPKCRKAVRKLIKFQYQNKIQQSCADCKPKVMKGEYIREASRLF